MLRYLSLPIVVFFLLAGALSAQDAWPAFSTGLPDNAIARGTGFYAAIWKLVMLLVLVWLWVKSAGWVGTDTEEIGEAIGMPGRIWNPILVFAPLVGFLLAITVPIFFVGWAVMLLLYLGPFIAYVTMRNGKVTSDKKVFTPENLKNWFANLGKRQAVTREAKRSRQSVHRDTQAGLAGRSAGRSRAAGTAAKRKSASPDRGAAESRIHRSQIL